MASAMSEQALQKHVIAAAQTFGWRVVHFRPAKTEKGWRTAIEGDKGFPDLVLARMGVVLHVELKTEKGKMTGDQERWAYNLGTSWELWRPSHWLSGEIARVLAKPGQTVEWTS